MDQNMTRCLAYSTKNASHAYWTPPKKYSTAVATHTNNRSDRNINILANMYDFLYIFIQLFLILFHSFIIFLLSSLNLVTIINPNQMNVAMNEAMNIANKDTCAVSSPVHEGEAIVHK
jgi:hypothetical protein